MSLSNFDIGFILSTNTLTDAGFGITSARPAQSNVISNLFSRALDYLPTSPLHVPRINHGIQAMDQLILNELNYQSKSGLERADIQTLEQYKTRCTNFLINITTHENMINHYFPHTIQGQRLLASHSETLKNRIANRLQEIDTVMKNFPVEEQERAEQRVREVQEFSEQIPEFEAIDLTNNKYSESGKKALVEAKLLEEVPEKKTEEAPTSTPEPSLKRKAEAFEEPPFKDRKVKVKED